MKSYVINGKFSTIYDGDVYKVVDEEGRVEFKADLKQYHTFDSKSGIWETWPIDSIHKNVLLSKEMYFGRVREFPSIELAKNVCNKERR